MKDAILQKSKQQGILPDKQYSYHELVEFLDANWALNQSDANLACIRALDKSFGMTSTALNTILIAGTNGKSLTAHYALKLFQAEGIRAGAFFSPHLMTYNERFVVDGETILNKHFTEIGNEVLAKAVQLGLAPTSLDVLTMMALLYFKRNDVEVALLEVNQGGKGNPVTICSPKIAVVTRITEQEAASWAPSLEQAIQDVMSIAKPGTHVVCADQSKLNLQIVQRIAEQQECLWVMPIRKLSPLAYPFEQLHGRCGSLAERIASIYMNNFVDKKAYEATSLLIRQKGQRGRPTLEAKRKSELNPKKTIDQFWKEVRPTLSGRFQLFDKEKPTVLVDTASNLDAINNFLLGIRLLHYQRPLKGLAIVLGCNNEDLDMQELLKLLRYFFKKTSGHLILCSVDPVPGTLDRGPCDMETLANQLRAIKVKAKAVPTLKQAYEQAAKLVDDRHGLVAVAGSSSIISEYWRIKGMKKL